MTDCPTISIITPVYNGYPFVDDTIKSVIKYAKEVNFEYIVVDDGSTDQTGTILRKYESQIKVIRQQNSGQASAINHALSEARGRYSLIVNADDPLISSELFIDALEVLESNDDVVATYPDWEIINSRNERTQFIKVKEFSLIELVGHSNCLVGPGGIFITEIARKVGGWNPSYRFVPDYDFFLKMSEHGIFKHIPKLQAVWRSHDNSTSIKSRGVDMAKERVRVIDDYLERNPNVPSKLKSMAKAHAGYQAAALAYFDNKVPGRKIIVKSLISYPRLFVEQDPKVMLFLLFLPFSRVGLYVLQKMHLVQNIQKKRR